MAAGRVIGVDVGGTKVAAGAVDPVTGQVEHRREIATAAERGAEAAFADIVALSEEVAADVRAAGETAHGVGICLPEIVDAEGRIRSAYLLDWKGNRFGERLAAVGPVVFASDVRAAAAAEGRFGAGRGYQSFVYVSVGTGISSSLVLDGVPLAGARGGAVVLSTGPVSVPCDACGGWSTFVLEEYASGRAVAERYLAATGTSLSTREVVLAAANGDHEAIAIVDSAATALGSAIGWLVNVFDPEAVVVGGGLGLAGGRYWDTVVNATRRHVWHDEARDLSIVPAALGADAGVIGAALTANRHGAQRGFVLGSPATVLNGERRQCVGNPLEAGGQARFR